MDSTYVLNITIRGCLWYICMLCHVTVYSNRVALYLSDIKMCLMPPLSPFENKLFNFKPLLGGGTLVNFSVINIVRNWLAVPGPQETILTIKLGDFVHKHFPCTISVVEYRFALLLLCIMQ